MRLFTLVFGSRIFWALLLIGGTVAAIELDRRGLAPWRQAATDGPVELPTVDLGEPGEPSAFDAEPGSFGFGDEYEFPSEAELDRRDDRDDLDDLADTGRRESGRREPERRETERRDNPYGFDERDLAAGFGDEMAGGFGDEGRADPLDEPDFGDAGSFGDETGLGDDDTFGDAGSFGDDLDDDPTTLGSRGERGGFDSFGGDFDPLLDEPFEPEDVGAATSRDRELDDLDRPLDLDNSFELELEPVDDEPPKEEVPARPTSEERRRPVVGPAELVLDVSAPTRMKAKETQTFEVVVRNTGGEPARDVVLTAHLDDGIEMPGRRARAARKRMGDLAPGETRRLELDLSAPKTGRPCVKFAVDATGLEAINKRICVRISAPSTAWNW